MNETVLSLFAGVFLAICGWGILTVHSLAVSTAELSASVQYLVVEDLPNRVTALEVLVQEMKRKAYGEEGNLPK